MERQPFAIVAAALTIAAVTRENPEAWIERHHPGDMRPVALLRAMQAPANTTTPEWAGVLVQNELLAYVSTLAASGAAALFARAGIRADFSGTNAAASVPGRKSRVGWAWVAEQQPIPVGSLDLTGVPLPASKLGAISVITEELAQGSSAQNIIEQIMREDVGTALDAAMFTDIAATEGQPAGLFNGTTALTAGADAVADLKALAEAVTTAAAPVYLMTGSQLIGATAAGAVSADGRIGGADVIVANGLPLGTVVYLDTSDMAVRIDARGVAIQTSPTAVLVMSDTPVPFADDDGTLGYPIMSTFQTACIAIRAIMPAAWAMRASGRLAFIEGVTW